MSSDGFERRAFDGAAALVSTALERDGVFAAFFERGGGASSAPYDSLNGSFTGGDATSAVRANRARVARAASLDRFCVPGLVHGTTIARVDRRLAADGFDGPGGALADADGTTTTRMGVGLGAFSADCVIAVLWHPGEGRLALVHAGWRGLAEGVLERGVDVFGDRGEVRAAIGPAIGPCHYEVGEDVALAVAAGSAGGAVSERRGGRRFLDLVGTARAELVAAGVRRVDDTGLCTACETARFYSYRRDGVTGRHLALAVKLRG